MARKEISAVVLSLNKLDYTSACLESLLLTTHDSWELIVIDNGSTDGTRQWLHDFQKDAARHKVPLKLILNESNLGCSTSRNQGIEAAEGRLVAFCDNDVMLRSRNWLKVLGKDFEDDKVAIAGPKIVYPKPPYDIQCAGCSVTLSGRVVFNGRGAPNDSKEHNRRQIVQCLISACCIARRSALDEVGGFDEAFNPVEYEDIDLCYKLRAQGHLAVYDPAAEMYHFESVTTEGTASISNTYLVARHSLLFKERWRHMFGAENGPVEDAARWLRIPPFSIGQAKLPLPAI
ncbi:MAG: glycosyltransferase family 2 protein [Victivallales bacterium]|nr:glycosyltransferase family 2 protein [Victivallales bacterium]